MVLGINVKVKLKQASVAFHCLAPDVISGPPTLQKWSRVRISRLLIGRPRDPFGRARYLFGYDGGRGAPAGGQQVGSNGGRESHYPRWWLTQQAAARARSVHVARCQSGLWLAFRPKIPPAPVDRLSQFLVIYKTSPPGRIFFPLSPSLQSSIPLLKKKPVLVWGARLSILFFFFS